MLELSVVIMAKGIKPKLPICHEKEPSNVFEILYMTLVEINGQYHKFVAIKELTTGTIYNKAPNQFGDFKLFKS